MIKGHAGWYMVKSLLWRSYNLEKWDEKKFPVFLGFHLVIKIWAASWLRNWLNDLLFLFVIKNYTTQSPNSLLPLKGFLCLLRQSMLSGRRYLWRVSRWTLADIYLPRNLSNSMSHLGLFSPQCLLSRKEVGYSFPGLAFLKFFNFKSLWLKYLFVLYW